MTVPFPNLCPTKRTFTPGLFPTKKFGSISGASTVRLYGSKAYDAELQLSFLLDDASTKELIDSWNASRGGFEELELPDSVFAGVGPDLEGAIPTYLHWRWAETPAVESLLPGRSRVQVKLVATLDA